MLESDPLKQFNRFYRDRRLEAEKKKKPFPSYNYARSKLEWAIELAKQAKIIDPIPFWNFVFNPDPPHPPKLLKHSDPRGRTKAVIRHEPTEEEKRSKVMLTNLKLDRKAKQRRSVVIDRARPMFCDVCKRRANLVVDHCHKTGIFRGWICNSCNFALGLTHDDPQILRRLARYLDKHLTSQKVEQHHARAKAPSPDSVPSSATCENAT
jgi:hypothetical protein